MITVFIWTVNGEWKYWCRCQQRCYATLLDIARQSGVECDYLGW